MAAAKYKRNSRGEFEARIWDGTYNADGSKHRKKLVSKKSSADLERIVNEFKSGVSSQGNTVYSEQTFTEYAWSWLETAKAAKEENTKAMYRNVIKCHLSFLSDIPVAEIRHSHFQQAINSQLAHPRTCQQIYITFRQIVRAAIRDHILPQNAFEDVAGDISLPKCPRAEKRPLTPIEKDAFMNAKLDGKKMAFVSILYFCGLRRAEALALSKDDFDWDAPSVSVSKAVIFDKNNGQPQIKPRPKSDNGIRTVPIPDMAVERIRPYADSSSGPYLFGGKNTEMMTLSSYNSMWKSIICQMNIAAGYNPNAKKEKGKKPIQGLTAHIFRHNYCTELCYQIPKISTKMIARLMGDTEKMVLEVYSHILDEKENIAETVNSAFK